MKVKNLNPLEQHVEKIVLAVAVLGAGYLGYAAYSSPVEVRPGTRAADAVSAVSGAVAQLRTQMQARSEPPANDQMLQVPDYLQQYARAKDTPLDERLLATIPPFGPFNTGPAQQGPRTSQSGRSLEIARIDVPPVQDLRVESFRAQVIKVPVGAPDAPAAVPDNPTAPPAEPTDMNWVKLTFRYSMPQLAQAVAGEKLPPRNRLPAEVQRITFYVPVVERQTLQPNGQWPGDDKWEIIPPTKAQPVPAAALERTQEPAEVAQMLDALDAAWQAILRPAFYSEVPPQLLRPTPPPAPGAVVPAPGRPDEFAARPAIPATPAPVIPPPPAVRPAGAPDLAFDAAAGAPAQPADQQRDTLLHDDNVTCWFIDDTVQPGQKYRYRIRFRIFNPLFRLGLTLQDSKAKNEPWALSKPVISPVVNIGTGRYVFLTHGMGSGRNSATFRIYQWQHGAWFRDEQSYAPGEQIGRVRTVPMSDKPINFETGYTVVSVEANGNGDVRAVLQGPNGDLVVRDSSLDQSDPQREKLDTEIRNLMTPATQPGGAAAMAPGGGMNP